MADLTERVATLEANEKTLFRQLAEIKESVKDMHRLTIAVEKIAVKTDAINSKVDTIDGRLNCVEKTPLEDFKHYKRLIIGGFLATIITAIITAALSLILK